MPPDEDDDRPTIRHEHFVHLFHHFPDPVTVLLDGDLAVSVTIYPPEATQIKLVPGTPQHKP